MLISKKKTCHQVNFSVQADNRVKIIDSEKRDKYLDFARELRKLWNNIVTVIQIVVVALWKFTKDFEKLEIRGKIETVQTTALKSATILTLIWKTLQGLK